MALHIEKTLKTAMQKNLPKSQISARKVSVVEFRYSQTIPLRFTGILFHNNEQKVTSNEQKSSASRVR